MALPTICLWKSGHRQRDRKKASSTAPPDCSFCKNIRQGKWKKVQKAIDRNLQRKNPAPTPQPAAGYWMDRHEAVAYVSPLPDAILTIFPSHWGHQVGFKRGGSIEYFNLTIQIGKIYRGRSRLQSWTSLLFPQSTWFRTGDYDYIGVKSFVPIPEPGLYPVNKP